MTVVMNLETGEILHVQEGKGIYSVKAFLEKLKRTAKIEAIAVEAVFGKNSTLVHDPFHVVAIACKAVDKTRRDLVREATAK